MAGKDKRIDSRFSIAGAFWPPNASDAISTGTLTSDKRQITFTTAPVYSRKPNKSESLTTEGVKTIQVMHGFTEDGTCTLLQLVRSNSLTSVNFSMEQSIKANAYRVSTCLMGMLINDGDDKGPLR